MGIESDIDALKEAVRYLLKREKERQENLITSYHNNVNLPFLDKNALEEDLNSLRVDIDRMINNL